MALRVAQRTVNQLYTATYTPTPECRGYILFVHGGPGSHSAYFEAALKAFPAYHDRMRYGWICYDQRGCGRSPVATDVSHQGNIADLTALVHELRTSATGAPIAIMGHSYGSWLLYDTLQQHSDLTTKAIFVGRAIDQALSKTRSLLMDLILLKMHQPEEYAAITAELGADANPFLAAHKTIIATMRARDDRKFFYWGNLQAMAWYEKVKAECAVQENDEVMRTVATTLYEMTGPLGDFDFSALHAKALLVSGFHDFLMGGETPPKASGVRCATLHRSGHFPHFEEPDTFVDLVSQFLETAA